MQQEKHIKQSSFRKTALIVNVNSQTQKKPGSSLNQYSDQQKQFVATGTGFTGGGSIGSYPTGSQYYGQQQQMYGGIINVEQDLSGNRDSFQSFQKQELNRIYQKAPNHGPLGIGKKKSIDGMDEYSLEIRGSNSQLSRGGKYQLRQPSDGSFADVRGSHLTDSQNPYMNTNNQIKQSLGTQLKLRSTSNNFKSLTKRRLPDIHGGPSSQFAQQMLEMENCNLAIEPTPRMRGSISQGQNINGARQSQVAPRTAGIMIHNQPEEMYQSQKNVKIISHAKQQRQDHYGISNANLPRSLTKRHDTAAKLGSTLSSSNFNKLHIPLSGYSKVIKAKEEIGQFMQQNRSQSTMLKRRDDDIDDQPFSLKAGTLKSNKLIRAGEGMNKTKSTFNIKSDSRYVDATGKSYTWQYKKGHMMQEVDFQNPNANLSRHASNLKNYYKQKEKIEYDKAVDQFIKDNKQAQGKRTNENNKTTSTIDDDKLYDSKIYEQQSDQTANQYGTITESNQNNKKSVSYQKGTFRGKQVAGGSKKPGWRPINNQQMNKNHSQLLSNQKLVSNIDRNNLQSISKKQKENGRRSRPNVLNTSQLLPPVNQNDDSCSPTSPLQKQTIYRNNTAGNNSLVAPIKQQVIIPQLPIFDSKLIILNHTLQQTEDNQLHECDSDHEYEMMKKTFKKATPRIYVSPRKDTYRSPRRSELSSLGEDGEELIQQKKNQEMFAKAHNMLTSYTGKEDTISQQQRGRQSQEALSKHLEQAQLKAELENNQQNAQNFALEDYKLTGKMSKMVKYSNVNVNKVIDTLNRTSDYLDMQGDKDDANGEDGEEEIVVEAPVLLNQTSQQIKNLNHTLMKLVAVQQQSIGIPKNNPSGFMIMDRVPVYLEIDAANMPHPCKIVIRPQARRYPEAVCELVAQNMTIYVSTKTKNPCERNHQYKCGRPAKSLMNFSPMPEPGEKKDIFRDKVYISIIYDLSVKTEGQDPDAEGEGDHAGGVPGGDIIQQINMKILVCFPKDKAEIQKKKLAAMLAKLGGSEKLDLTGIDGKKRMEEINRGLTKYALVNKETQKNRGKTTLYTDQSMMENQQQYGFQEVDGTEGSMMSQSQANNFGFNQMVDMYAAGQNQFANEGYSQMSQPGMEGMMVGQPMVTQFGDVDHVARNAFISSQYKYMNGIRSQVNQDILYTRLFNSQQRSQIIDSQKRLKSMQWLNKWDEFRMIKMQYADQAIEIMKSRRRVINLIGLMSMVTFIKGVQNNYMALKEYNMLVFTKIMTAAKLKYRYQKVFCRNWGYDFDDRQRNQIRRSITTSIVIINDKTREKAAQSLIPLLQDSDKKHFLKLKMAYFYENVYHIQQSFKRLLLQRLMNANYAQLRFKQELARLRFFYLEKASKIKICAKIFSKLQDLDTKDVTTSLKIDEVMSDYRAIQKIRYNIYYQEVLYCQMEVLFGKTCDHEDNFELFKDRMMAIGSKMSNMQAQVDELEMKLYCDGEKAHARLLKDAPHENSRAPKDYDVKEVEVVNDDIENPVAEVSEVPVKKLPPKVKVFEEKQEVIDDRRVERKLELSQQNVQNKKLQLQLVKMEESKKRRQANKMMMPAVYSSSGGEGNRISIFTKQDEKLGCYEEVMDIIRNKKLDIIEPHFVSYTRIDMFNIIFKLANVNEAFNE